MLKALFRLLDTVIQPTAPAPAAPRPARVLAAVAPVRPDTRKAATPSVPPQSSDPRRFAGAEGVGAWVLKAGDPTCACEFALANDGRRFSAAGAIPLPAPSCCRSDCACMYKPLPEERKAARRLAVERREQVRFGAKSDRRANSGRRLEDRWDRKRV